MKLGSLKVKKILKVNLKTWNTALQISLSRGRNSWFANIQSKITEKCFCFVTSAKTEKLLRCSTSEPERLCGERGLSQSSYDTHPAYC